MPEEQVTLRDFRDELGTRRLSATLTAGGDLRIDGQDLGRGVEEYWGSGCREYEWSWTVAAADVPQLKRALGGRADVLIALRDRFSDDDAIGLKPFLEDNGIPHEVWSRVGD